jgi:two-component system, OmpR family, sensor histidine kinase KdpD
LARLSLRILVSVAGVAVVTITAHRFVPVNATTVGFVYLLLVLGIASTWGFIEAAIASLLATLLLNFFFFPPLGTLTIADPQNWVALFSFLATALIASRLSAKAERRAAEAIARRQDVEHLYTFSRSILLIDGSESFPKQLARTLAEAFGMEAVVLYDRRTDQMYRGGPGECEGLDDQLREAALQGASFSDAQNKRLVTAIRLGSEPIAALALQGAGMPDSVVQGIANLVAIGLERARAQDLAHQVEAARRSEQLRTTVLDAMAHEFKTPLTSIKAATTALRAEPGQPQEARTELVAIADEEAERLRLLIDDSIEMARLDTEQIDLNREPVAVAELARDAAASLQPRIEGRQVQVACEERLPPLYLDRRLVRLAIRQVLDNALKYSPPGTPVQVRVAAAGGFQVIDITDQGKGIPPEEQERLFERFYRGASSKQQIPGSGLGLSIAYRILEAHGGALTVSSRPGETTFRMTLPAAGKGDPR